MSDPVIWTLCLTTLLIANVALLLYNTKMKAQIDRQLAGVEAKAKRAVDEQAAALVAQGAAEEQRRLFASMRAAGLMVEIHHADQQRISYGTPVNPRAAKDLN